MFLTGNKENRIGLKYVRMIGWCLALLGFILLVMLIFGTENAEADTVVPPGPVNDVIYPGGWNNAGSPYWVQGPIEVPPGDTLTIDGSFGDVDIRFNGSFSFRVGTGGGSPPSTLMCMAAGSNITFTTNGINPSWLGIEFADTAAPGSIIDGATIEYTSGGPDVALWLNGTTGIQVINCEIRHVQGITQAVGIGLYHGSGILNTDNNFLIGNYIHNVSIFPPGPFIASGISLNNAHANMIDHNRIEFVSSMGGGGGGGCAGIYLKDSSFNTILIDNVINNIQSDGNIVAGIELFGDCDTNTIELCDIFKVEALLAPGEAFGIRLEADGLAGTTPDSNTISYNTIREVKSLGLLGYGICASGANSATLSNNKITDCDNGVYIRRGTTANLINGEICDNIMWGIYTDKTSSCNWVISTKALLLNNPVKLNGTIQVTGEKLTMYNILSSEVKGVSIASGSTLELAASPTSIISNDVWVNGTLYINSSKWEINVSSNGQYGIQVNSTGTMIIQDNGTGPSTITDGPYDNDGGIIGTDDFRYYFQVLSGAKFRLLDSTVSEVGWGGGSWDEQTIWIDTTDAHIRGSTLKRNHFGIIMQSGGWTFENNKIFNVSGTGMWVGTSMIVANNTIKTGAASVSISTNTNNQQLINNTIYTDGSSTRCINIQNSRDHIIIDNTLIVNGSGGWGIFLGGSTGNNTIDNNTIKLSLSDQYGIYLFNTNQFFLSNPSEITLNKISNGGIGISLDQTTDAEIIIGNNTLTNNLKGIELISNSHAILYNNEIYDNTQWGITMDGTCSGTWLVDTKALLANNPALLNGNIYVNSGKLTFSNISSSDVRGAVNIGLGSMMELIDSPNSLITQEVWVDSVLYVNSSKWEINCTTSNSQYGIQVNDTGTMIVQDTGMGPSNISDSPFDNDGGILGTDDFRFDFKVLGFATFQFLDSELYECGWNGGATERGLWIQPTDVIVRGNTIKNCHRGMSSNGGNAKIENNILQNIDSLGMWVSGGTPSYIANNTIYMSGVGDEGIWISSDGHWIINNTINTQGLTSYAIYCQASDNVQIIDNKINTSGTNCHGIYLDVAADNCVIDDNKIKLQSKVQYGIYIRDSYFAQITSNIISGSDTGIYLEGSTGNTIRNNTIHNNNYGLQFTSGSKADIFNNEIYDNTMWGLWMDVTSSGDWTVDEYALLKNNDALVNGSLSIILTGEMDVEKASLQMHDVMIELNGTLEVLDSKSTIISWNLTINGLTTLDNASWEMNNSFDGEHWIDVTNTGNLNVINNSLITAYNPVYQYDFWVNGTATFMDSMVEYVGYSFNVGSTGIFVTNPNVIFDNMTIRHCFAGIGISGVSITVYDVEIYNCSIGIGMFNSSGIILDYVYIHDLYIAAMGWSVGIYAENYTDVTIANATLYNLPSPTFSTGISFSYSFDFIIENSKMENIDGFAVFADNSSGIMNHVYMSNSTVGVQTENSTVDLYDATFFNHSMVGMSIQTMSVVGLVDGYILDCQGGIRVAYDSTIDVNHITIENRTVAMDTMGINAEQGTAYINDTTILNITIGIAASDSSYVEISNSFINDSASMGILCFDSTLEMRNTTIYNTQYIVNSMGIMFSYSFDFVIENVNIENMYSFGVFADNSSGIMNHVDITNGWVGLQTENSTVNLFDATFFNHSIVGMSIQTTSNVELVDGHLVDCQGGIRVAYGSTIFVNHTLMENLTVVSDTVGIQAQQGSAYINDTTILNMSGGIVGIESSYIEISNSYINDSVSTGIQCMQSTLEMRTTTIYNATVYGVYLQDSLGNTIYDSFILNTTQIGLVVFYYADVTVYDTTIDNTFVAGWIDMWATVLIVNSTISNVTGWDFGITTDSHVTTLNTSFNNASVYFGDELSNLTVQWFLHVKVEGLIGEPVPGANVNVQDNANGNFDASFVADSGSYVRWIVITEYIQNQSVTTYYTPHTIQAWNATDSGQRVKSIYESMVVVVPFDVEVPTIDYIRIEYFNGMLVTEGTTMTADEELVLYARGYNFTFGPVGDVDVNWSVNGSIGFLSGATGTSVIFNATTVGIGNISISYDSFTNITGNITVLPGAVSRIEIMPWPTTTASTDDIGGFNAVGYDADGNENWLWTPAWSWLSTVLGVIDASDPFNITVDYNLVGSDPIHVEVMGSPGIFNETGITVSAGMVAEIMIIPGGAETNTTDEILNFTVEGYDADGNLNTSWTPTVLWTGPNLGVISINGFKVSIELNTVGASIINVSDSSNPSVYNDTKSITVNVGSPYQIVYVSGNGQSGLANSVLPSLFIVRVEDMDGNPVPNVEINWIIDGWPIGAVGHSLSNSNSMTDVNGEAATTLTLGDLAGVYWVNATNISLVLVGEPITFSAMATLYTVDEILITDQFGVPINDTMLSADVTLTLYAWGYNYSQGIIGPVAVNWSFLGGIGVFTTPTTLQTQATFDLTTLGIGNISAEYNSITNITGNITVIPGAVAEIIIRPTSATNTTDGSDVFRAVGYDADGNENWTWIPDWGWETTVLGVLTPIDLYNYSVDYDAVGMDNIKVNVSGNPLIFNTSSVTVSAGKVVEIVIIPGGAETNTTDEILNFTVEGYDADGNLNTSWTPNVVWVGANLGIISITDFNVSIEFNLVGTSNINVSDTGDPNIYNDSKSLMVNPGAPYSIVYVSGRDQVGFMNMMLPNPFVVRVEDMDGNPVPNVEINWTLDNWPFGASGQSLSDYNSITDSAGEATTTLTLGDMAGLYYVNATNLTLVLIGDPVSFNASVTMYTIDEIWIADQFGTPFGELILTTDDDVTLYAWAYNATGGLLGQIAVNWSSLGGIGVFTTSTILQSQATFDLTTPGEGNITVTFENATLILTNTTDEIKVRPGAVASIIVTPSSATGTTDDSDVFMVVGYDADGNENWSWTPNWAWDTTVLGTFTPIDIYNYTVDYTVTGSDLIIVSVAGDPGVFGSASVTVTPGQLVRLEITPWPSTTASTDDIGAFSVIGYDADGNENSSWSPVWNWEGTGLGILTQVDPFTYTVDYDITGSDTINVTVFGNPNIYNTTDVTVNAGQVVRIEIVPWPSINQYVGNTETIRVTGYDADGNENWTWTPAWNLEGGIGILTPDTPYNYSVDYTTVGLGNITVNASANPIIYNMTSVSVATQPTVDYIVIMDAPGGTGNIVTTRTYSVGDTDTFYAAGFNYTSDYVEDVEVTWASLNVTNGTVIAGPGNSTTFTANDNHGGLVIVTATNSFFIEPSNSTGLLTILDPEVDYIQIRDAPNNGGVIVSARSYSEGEQDVFYAAGYNHTAGYIRDVSVDWTSITPIIGDVSPSSGESTTFTAGSVSGTTTVTATYPGDISNSTGILTVTVEVVPPTIDYVLIRDSLGEEGNVVTDVSMNGGETGTYYAAGYNLTTRDFVSNVIVVWSAPSNIGTIDVTTGLSTNFTASNAPGVNATGIITATHNDIDYIINVTIDLPPTAPTDPSVAQRPQGESLTITWTENDEVDVIGYRIYRSESADSGFEHIGTNVDPSNTTYTDTGLTDGTTYYYYMEAYDAGPNYSPDSTTVNEVSDTNTDGDDQYNLEDDDDDNDGLLDTEEDEKGTNPLNPDTDGDGKNDKEDAYPLDDSRWKKEEEGISPALILLPIIVIIIVFLLLFLLLRKRKPEEELPEEEMEEMEGDEEEPEEEELGEFKEEEPGEEMEEFEEDEEGASEGEWEELKEEDEIKPEEGEWKEEEIEPEEGEWEDVTEDEIDEEKPGEDFEAFDEIENILDDMVNGKK